MAVKTTVQQAQGTKYCEQCGADAAHTVTLHGCGTYDCPTVESHYCARHMPPLGAVNG